MQKEEWFETWFDHPLYTKLYANRDDSEAAKLVAMIARSYPPDTFPEVLDMGCGRGRHSRLLGKLGYRVTGVDLSPSAIKKAKEATLNESAGLIQFKTGDMRTYQGPTVDLVGSFFTSFGYFLEDDENRSVIKNMKSNLKRGGYLILDYLNPNVVLSELVPEERLEVDGMICDITRDVHRGVVQKTMVFFGKNQSETLKFKERVKLYPVSWFEEAFRDMGMRLEDIRGDYDGHTYDENESSRMIMMARY